MRLEIKSVIKHLKLDESIIKSAPNFNVTCTATRFKINLRNYLNIVLYFFSIYIILAKKINSCGINACLSETPDSLLIFYY